MLLSFDVIQLMIQYEFSAKLIVSNNFRYFFFMLHIKNEKPTHTHMHIHVNAMMRAFQIYRLLCACVCMNKLHFTRLSQCLHSFNLLRRQEEEGLGAVRIDSGRYTCSCISIILESQSKQKIWQITKGFIEDS